MAGLIKSNVQLGDSATATQNFTLTVPATPDGTVKLARGNAGATTQDILTVAANGAAALRGTDTNDSAATGFVGEYVSGQRLFASRTAATTSTALAVTSITLSAGDWDVDGVLGLSTDATTNVTLLRGKIATSVAAVGADDLGASGITWPGVVLNTPTNGTPTIAISTTRISLSAPTTVYLVGQVNFTVATAAVFGQICARRVR